MIGDLKISEINFDELNKININIQSLINEGRMDLVSSIYKKLLESFPSNYSLLKAAATLYIQQSYTENALDLLQRAFIENPNDNEIIFLLGLAYYKLGTHEESIKFLIQLPDNSEAQLLLGRLYSAKGAHGAAVLSYEKSAQNLSSTELSMAYLYSGSDEKAEYLLNQLIISATDQNLPWLIMEYGLLKIRQNKFNDIVDQFVALSNHPSQHISIPSTGILVEGFSRLGNHQLAIELATPFSSSNWSHLFVAVTQAKFRLLSKKTGVEFIRAPHPHPGSSIGVTISSLAYYGRFGHQMSEYFHIRWIAEKYNIPFETPDWIGHYVFELNDPLSVELRKLVKFDSNRIESELKLRGSEAICGYDFFSPGSINNWNSSMTRRAQEIFRIRDCWLPYLEPALEKLKSIGKTIVTVHIRRTDTTHIEKYQKISWYLSWLKEIWPSLNKPVLYICSDDLPNVITKFSEFHPLTINNSGSEMSGFEFLQDFYILMNSNVIAISRSGFSLMAAMLNQQNARIYQPDFRIDSLSEFSTNDMQLINIDE